MGLSELSVSDDLFHSEEPEWSLAKNAIAAAVRLDLPVDTISIEKSSSDLCSEPPSAGEAEGESPPASTEKGKPIIGGDVKFVGRAVEKLSGDYARVPWQILDECTLEKLDDPGRVHVDSLGNVHLCQGLLIGNAWDTALSELISAYDPRSHPIVRPLLEAGPAGLAEAFGVEHEETYVDACHLCYEVRRGLVDRFPGYLAPRLVYGL
jgi:hypothetical protein